MTALQSLSLANTFIPTTDPDVSLAFYRDVLGFTVKEDVTNGDFRWVTLTTPTQPELELTLDMVGTGAMPMTAADRVALTELLAKGLLAALIFDCDDVDAVFEAVRSSGAEVLQEPADQFYGVRDCAFRDPHGTMVRFKTDLVRE
ncbi:MAG: VOC family protein [Micropruina sp.]|uniref:VOC family protein n=1 Tax=Micropruina sp. TaxID=2737536 RepID=UPI0039E2B590